MYELGHGGEGTQDLPRMIEALAGKKEVIGVSAGLEHTVVWTKAGELFTFGAENNPMGSWDTEGNGGACAEAGQGVGRRWLVH